MLGTFGILFCSYRLYLRDKYFIDRKNKTLHTITLLKKLDKKIKDTAIYMLREHVLKDEATINMTAKHLLKLVNEEQFVTDQITDIMILLLKEGIDFNKETRGLTEWAIINWMKTIGKD